MKITTYISEKKKKDASDGMAYLGFRVRGKGIDLKVRTEIEVVGEFWDCDNNSYAKTRKFEKCLRIKTNDLVAHIMETINDEFYDESMKGTADADWVRGIVERWLYPKPSITPSLAERIEQYAMEHPMADSTAYNYQMTAKKVRRYDAYQRDIDDKTGFALKVETITVEELEDFRDFLINEHLLYEELPEFFAQFHIKVQDIPKQLSQTRVGNIMTHLRIVQHWCNNMGYSNNKSCDEFSIPQPTFGTPFYLTIEERNKVFAADLSYRPSLILYRDLFVFQSLVGCRSGDLFRFTKDNVQGDMLIFIPEKTKNRNPTPVEVPLSGKAKGIIAKYDGMEGKGKLFPKRDMTHYNNGIKDILRDLGIDRPVTILNKYTKENEQKPIWEVASSHMARRTFIGNLYKRVKDPSLIGSMTGHVNGSRSFERYRAIDDEIKQELVNMIN